MAEVEKIGMAIANKDMMFSIMVQMIMLVTIFIYKLFAKSEPGRKRLLAVQIYITDRFNSGFQSNVILSGTLGNL